ncbi:MAG: hypothetical protein HPZ91_12680 [Lentisphaeria bacterium]|nr:hypothetical protein [Lentisphaeria bacterium]
MNIRTIVSAIAFLGLLSGCAPTITVNDTSYKALTASEERHLISAARMLLMKPGRVVTKDEVRIVQKTEPELKITYTGDRSGRAAVRWNAPQKIIVVHFDGELTDNDVSVSISTEKRQSEILKFTEPKK